jgi:hypothetical protein
VPKEGAEMAHREIGMWETFEVLRRVARGEAHRTIERVTGHSHNTIVRAPHVRLRKRRAACREA